MCVKFFAKKIREAAEKRADFFASDDTSAFRVFNGEGDGIGGLTIDFFNGFYFFIYKFIFFVGKVTNKRANKQQLI